MQEIRIHQQLYCIWLTYCLSKNAVHNQLFFRHLIWRFLTPLSIMLHLIKKMTCFFWKTTKRWGVWNTAKLQVHFKIIGVRCPSFQKIINPVVLQLFEGLTMTIFDVLLMPYFWETISSFPVDWNHKRSWCFWHLP